MKTLHAKNAIILNMIYAGLPFVIFLLFSINEFREGDIHGGAFWVLCSILIVPFGVFGGIRIYRTHWIKYGDGKVTIRRVSKDCINGGRPLGKWKNREDTFLLEEIESYGLSWRVLGHCLEYHRSSGASLTTEYFFKLKSGKMIGFEIIYYTRNQDKEFRRYIYENTGIEFQEPKKKRHKRNT